MHYLFETSVAVPVWAVAVGTVLSLECLSQFLRDLRAKHPTWRSF